MGLRSTLVNSRTKTIQQKVMSLIQDSAKIDHLLQIHSLIIKTSIHQNNFILSRFLGRLFSCYSTPDLSYPRSVFSSIQCPDTFIWNTMIWGYLNNQYPHEALSLFVKMRFQEGVFVDSFSLSLVLQACGRSIDHVNGRTTHTQVLKLGFCSDLFVQTALVEMYAKCGCIDMARAIFDNMSNPDVVSCNVLLVEYVSCGEIRSARELFDNMSERDLVSWNTMIHGYASANELQGKKSFYPTRSPLIATCSKNRQSNEALRLFQEMQVANMVPDKVTFVSVLLACCEMGALGTGKMVHEFILSSRFKIDLKLGTALVDMYAKCGDIDNSLRVFNAMHKKDVFAWSAMIVGLANHGLGELALDHFSRMISEQITPNSITFIGVLSACSHVGLVDMGMKYFNDMNDVYGISPKLEHYGCMIDILGRAGQVQEARELIRSMPFAPDAIIWRAFLGACVIYKNVELAEEATVQLLELEPHVDGNYVLLSNLYSQAKKWDKVMDVRRMMTKCTNIQKGPGSSCLRPSVVVVSVAPSVGLSRHKHSNSEVRGRIHREGSELVRGLLYGRGFRR